MAIRVKGARENNLKSVDVEFKPGLTVVTGVSGSGKTSLVFETIYHEARRRFEEVFAFGNLSQRLSPIQVDSISGLGPAVAVGQNLLNRNPNSTIATASGLHPFLRLLYARFGTRACPNCGKLFNKFTEDEIVAQIVHLNKENPVTILAPIVRGSLGSHKSLLRMLVNSFSSENLIIDDRVYKGETLNYKKVHDITLILGSLEKNTSMLEIKEKIQQARALGSPVILVHTVKDTLKMSSASVCSNCGTWFSELLPKDFHSPLTPMASSVNWMGYRFDEILKLDVESAHKLFYDNPLNAQAERLFNEITKRLANLRNIGLGYITLNRPSPTLSRGESQRVRLAVSLSSNLKDILHILDEPTIGQHPWDVKRLVPNFRKLEGSVIYIEHDRVAAALADHAIDIGPEAGVKGGEIVFEGKPRRLWEADTATGRYFSLKKIVEKGKQRSEPNEFIEIRGANANNLKDINVRIPVRRLTTVTGVSGSGKSTLIEDVLVKSLKKGAPIGCKSIHCNLKPVLVDQSPIGRNPRSTPATYTKLSDIIREHYAEKTGLSRSHFSFNRPEGACPTCKGMGALEVKMRYLPSTWITCIECGGRKYKDEVLEAKVEVGDRNLSVADFYNLSIEEAHNIIKLSKMMKKNRKKALRMLKALEDIGLGYLSLGQPSPTLSGGEAQRVKLAKYLGGGNLNNRLIVLDEPSTGLHPEDISCLLKVLDNLVDRGATALIVEHNLDIIRAADWVIDLGPGAGPMGGEVIYIGSSEGLKDCFSSLTGQALLEDVKVTPKDFESYQKTPQQFIKIRGAKAHNLNNIDVEFPKGKISVVTGVSGSGKSSLVRDILETEARRRYLETLSIYERQGVKEGPEAPVDEVTGLGVTVTLTPERKLYSRRNTVGATTEIAFHIAALLSSIGTRNCTNCGAEMIRETTWRCTNCDLVMPIAASSRFDPNTYRAACPTCNGVGSLQRPNPKKLIKSPEKPLCGGAMHSPGFFPKGYLCKPGNNGYDVVLAFATRYDFDPAMTPWNEVPENVRNLFYYGDPTPLVVKFRSRSGGVTIKTLNFSGFYGWIRDWDVGGTYTDNIICPNCNGARLKPEYLAVKLQGYNIHQLSTMPLSKVFETTTKIRLSRTHRAHPNLQIIQRRLGFLNKVGLGYIKLNRVSATLSAGEAQRVKLAGLLGSEITNLTVILDEPSRGLHPKEVNTLFEALSDLRNVGNTVIVVEHDLEIIEKADHIIDMGPGPGIRGGEIVFNGPPEEIKAANSITGKWLSKQRPIAKRELSSPSKWMIIEGAEENNLKGETVKIPLNLMVGICGVSGSGKSTLIIDTIGRILAPAKHTTSVAREPLEPGKHKAILNRPRKTLIVDQTRKGIQSPAKFLKLDKLIIKAYANGPEARALGLDERKLGAGCSVCRGSGFKRIDMGFLPDIFTDCETCNGTGYSPEAWEVSLKGYRLPEINQLTITEVYELFKDTPRVAEPLKAAIDVGLGYLVLHQPGYSLSGGEAQRLKIAAELAKKTGKGTLYILDEPTLGQHMEDVDRLIHVLHKLVVEGNSVIVVEHHPTVLTNCDWIIELGPKGGEAGGYIIASCPPTKVKDTPTAPYIKKLLEI